MTDTKEKVCEVKMIQPDSQILDIHVSKANVLTLPAHHSIYFCSVVDE